MFRIAIVVAAMTIGHSARAQEASEGTLDTRGSLEVYTDTDSTTVVTLLTDAAWQVTDTFTFTPELTVDVVSSASVDVISAATPRFSTVRLGPAIGGRYRVGKTTIGLIAVGSFEEDWISGSGQLTASRSFAQDNAEVSAGIGYTYNSISDARDEFDFKDTMQTFTWELGFSQLLGRKTRFHISHTGQVASGFNASPYREVVFDNLVVQPERHPDRRVRLSLAGSLHHYVGNDIGLWATYRFYGDSWSLYSHTVTLRMMKDLSEHFSLQLRGRGYLQTEADFYQDSYDAPENFDFFTFDKELAGLWSGGGGAAVIWRANETWTSSLRGEAYHFRYRNFSELRGRTAIITTVSANALW